jgi:hypothetical protein
MRRNLLAGLAASCTLLSLAGFVTAQQPSPQPTFTVLFTFQTFGLPGAITEVGPGRLLGTIGSPAAIFSITAKGEYKNIYTFPPNRLGLFIAGLTPALNSQTYGSASNGGPVTTFSELFSVAPDGGVATHPYNGQTQGGPNILVQHPDGQLYTTFGTADGFQKFSRMDYAGNATSLYTFGAGYPAYKTMFLGQDGNFYGLWITSQTVAGIYRITPTGSFSWVVPSFPTNTDVPPGLVQANNGNLYGTTLAGGPGGSIYEATLDGKMRTIYQFPKPEFGLPNWMIAASDGNLYGTAEGEYAAGYHGYSSIFRINPNTAQFETVYAMKDPRQAECPCQLTQGSDGKIYGIAYNGGTYGAGTVFALDAGLPPPKPYVGLFNPAAARVGRNVLLWGSGLLGTTAVSFNGMPAAGFGVPSRQGIWVQVPAGATSGPVTVTTPNGTYTTSQGFTVLGGSN